MSLRFALTGLAALTTILSGCSTSIRHSYVTVHPAGEPLPIEVQIVNPGEYLYEGAVHVASNGSPYFEPVPLERRGDMMWAILSTEQLGPDDQITYYIDVASPEKMHTLGSPTSPFRVTLLDRTGMILANLSLKAHAYDSNTPVRIVLHAKGQPIGPPMIEYFVPGVPGQVHAAMEPDGRGNYSIEVSPYAVQPGVWRFAVVVPIDGIEHRLPEFGFQKFTVTEPVYDDILTGVEEHLPH